MYVMVYTLSKIEYASVTQNSEILPHTHMWCFTRVKTPLNDLYKTRLSSQQKNNVSQNMSGRPKTNCCR